MKYFQLLFLSFVLSFALVSCGDESTSSRSDSTGVASNGGETTTTSEADVSESNTAVSTWDGHSLKADGNAKGKWKASVTFGEELVLLGSSENDGKHDYEKVQLLDGKEGWVRGDLISKGGSLAAVKTDAQIYKRPSISNITDNMVDRGQLVVIIQTKEEFSEFVSSNSGGKKRKKGWILGNNSLTTVETDIAASVMLSKAMGEKNPIKREKKLQDFVNNSTFSGSVFLETAQAALEEASAGANLSEDQLMITADAVNIRSAPDVEADNKLFQAHSGDICKIVKRGEMSEISGNLDYWYEIKLNGEKGWVFGSLTSKAL